MYVMIPRELPISSSYCKLSRNHSQKPHVNTLVKYLKTGIKIILHKSKLRHSKIYFFIRIYRSRIILLLTASS